METPLLLLLLLVVGLFVASFVIAGRPSRPVSPAIPFIAGLVFYVVYEFSVQKLHPEWNIRTDLVLVLVLIVVSGIRLAIAPGPAKETSATAKWASRSLYLGLVGIVFYVLPFLSIASIVLGHRALAGDPTPKDRVRARIGLVVSYVTLLLFAAAWGGWLIS